MRPWRDATEYLKGYLAEGKGKPGFNEAVA